MLIVACYAITFIFKKHVILLSYSAPNSSSLSYSYCIFITSSILNYKSFNFLDA
jgi:hypothetical protein